MSDPTWHPVALGRDVPLGTSAGVVLHGQEIAVWRDVGGVVHAWQDRCPHRGMKLSFGFVRGDHIACLYHGWEYDAGGRCQRIPAHPDLVVPATICVPTYAATEASGLIWVSLEGVPGETPEVLDQATPVRSLFVDAPAGAVADLLRDAGNPLGAEAVGEGTWRALSTRLADVRVGLHAIGPERSALHLVVAGQAPVSALIEIAARAEAFRRVAEGRA